MNKPERIADSNKEMDGNKHRRIKGENMNWNFDMQDAPRPGYGDRKKHGDILIAISGSPKMIVTHWIPQDDANREGRWFNVQPDEEPLAWCEIEHPSPQKKVSVSLPAGVSLPPGV